MNGNFKKILLAASILVFLASACDGEGQDSSETGPPPGGQLEAPTPTPAGNTGEADQAAPGTVESISGEDPERIPSQQERDAILDGVNLAPGTAGSDGGETVEGPAPGTESVQGGASDLAPAGNGGDTAHDNGTAESGQAKQGPAGPKEPVSGKDPEGVPSLEERNAILDGVNRGPSPPERAGGGTGEGPPLGTESHEGN